MDQVALNSQEQALFDRLELLCQEAGVTISGLDREPTYLMVYLTGAATCRLQCYYSTKVGWTTANLATDQGTIDHNQAFQTLSAKLRQLEED